MSSSLLKRATRFAEAEQLADILGEEPEWPWVLTRRPEQEPPAGDWRFWLVLSGRGFGKTKTGSELVCDWVEQGVKRIAIAARTATDVRDTLVEGESGVVACARARGIQVRHRPGLKRVEFAGGCIASTYSADRPDCFRGPQFEKAFCDEFASWRYVDDAWANLQMTLRRGKPQAVITTTPRPIPAIRDLLKRRGVYVTRGTTYANRENLAPEWFDEVISIFEGTRLGRQELDGEVLGDAPGALWNSEQLDGLRVTEHPPLLRTVVGVDPAVSSKAGSAETGIVVVGAALCQCKGTQEVHLFVLDDATGDRVRPSIPVQSKPLEWAQRVLNAFRGHSASVVVAEINQGGDLVTSNLQQLDALLPITTVTAHDGKRARAEPISALYQQRRVHHLGRLATLEDQMTTWEAMTSGERSPDRIDALVWACTELLPLVRSGARASGQVEKNQGFSFGVKAPSF